KAQAAPNGTAAAELWVAADAVTAAGDCDRVGDTSAPPVIPAAVQPVQPASDSGGETAPVEPVPGATGLPSGGTWVFNMNPTTNASCEGTQNISLATTEFFESLSQVYAVPGVNRDTFNYGE